MFFFSNTIYVDERPDQVQKGASTMEFMHANREMILVIVLFIFLLIVLLCF
ncbi:hypothetical protein [Paenibacillus azoreducens]|uniref:Uncharacterized protein n=1 Tax=Paenibacillus azoreducens TaxID=116718 RepID=A0A920CNV6_9BACL|nr:hypothetical protein [Paenibacillus azoreducens]GIO47891.1 hypothetical protein J34TS1_26560 [Paenibacillus azoreducens]